MNDMKIKRVFKREIRGKNEYEIENKAKKIFKDIFSELDKEGILLFKSPEAPTYYQERKFVFLGRVYVSVEKDLIQETFTLTVEHFGRSNSAPFYSDFDRNISMLEGLARKYYLKEQQKK